MIEKIIYDYLNNVLDVPAYLQRPDDAPNAFVYIEKTGSSRYNKIDSATLAIQSYATSRENAALLNEKVKRAMDNAVTLDAIADSHINTDYYFPDLTKRNYRYQAVYGLTYYNE